MDPFSGVHLFHFFLILLRNFDSILRPFFPDSIAILAVPPPAFPSTSSNDQTTPRSFSDCTVPAPENQLTQIYLLSLYPRLLPCTSSIFTVFNTHGFLLYFQRLQTFSDCISTRQINSLNLLAFIQPTALRYTSSISTVFNTHGSSCISNVFKHSNNTTPCQTALAPDKSSNLLAFFYPRLLPCTSSISTVSSPASQNFSNASINSTALFSDCATD